MLRRTFLQSTAVASLVATLPGGVARAIKAAPMPALLAPFTGPYGGVPPFDKIAKPDFKPAMLRAMDICRGQIVAIAESTEAPTFANTIGAYEEAGRELDRVSTVFGVYTSTMNDKVMQGLEQELAPQMAAFSDEITQNAGLFKRMKTLWDGRAKLKLTPEEARLLEVHYRAFARRGAALDKRAKARLAAINQQLAGLYTKFSQNQLADEENQSVVLEAEADLDGLPDTLRASLKTAAEAKGQQGKWLVSNTRSSVDPFLTYAARRDLREKVWRMFVSRGEHAGAHDNRPIIAQILTLRAERAKLLGFKTHAHWILDDTMAKKPEAARALLMKVWKPAVARVREEVADMQQLATADKVRKLAAWDYRYYAEKVRKAKYDLDANEVKQYLQLDKMREAMFWAAKQLYDLDFKQVKKLPVYHPDVTTYEVTRGGKHVGLWYFDPYAREGKRSGAWMSEYRTQQRYLATATPIVSNNSNFVKGKPGEPVLISWDDATTLFHEFGHALHGLLSNVTFRTLAGTNTMRDFVEFPSQINEHWLSTRELLDKFALHYKTGKPMPAEVLAKVEKAKNFNQGFSTVEYLMSAIYDLEIHTSTARRIDASAFEKKLFKDLGAPAEIVMRHRPTQFGHIFSGDGYSAGYYSYMWSDTLTADAGEAFVEAGGYYDKATAKRFHDTIMSVGNSVPQDVAFRNFRGRDVDTNALMRDRGFPVPAKKKK